MRATLMNMHSRNAMHLVFMNVRALWCGGCSLKARKSSGGNVPESGVFFAKYKVFIKRQVDGYVSFFQRR